MASRMEAIAMRLEAIVVLGSKVAVESFFLQMIAPSSDALCS